MRVGVCVRVCAGFGVQGLGCSGLRSFPSACRHHLTDDVALFRFCSALGPQDSDTTPATHGDVEQSGYILPPQQHTTMLMFAAAQRLV